MKVKKFIAIILALAMILSFAACSEKKEEVEKEISQEDIEKQREEELKNDPSSNLKLTLAEWPIIDGATAMLPYYEEAAARILDLPIEEARLHVLCNTTNVAYDNLMNYNADLIFCAPPSDDQVQRAKNLGIEFEAKQVLNSGFVFFVNKNNPVNNLTKEQLHDIYAGKITNWSQLGGLDEEIIAYQRSEGSGSQSGLYKHLIAQEDVMEAPIEQKIGAMSEIIDAVAQYDNSTQAIGYSYYYYITNMHYQEDVKLLAIDGIYPTNETISSGMYPFISETAAYFRSNEPEDSVVRKIAAWCAGAAGNIMAEDLGYVPSKNSKTVIPSYAKVAPTKGEWSILKQNNIKLNLVDCRQDYMGEYSTATYFQVEGLKDSKVQDKINARIKEVAEELLFDDYIPKYRGAALKDLEDIRCGGLWCNECFNANNILSLTVYASYNTPEFTSNFAETVGLNFNLNTGEELKLSDLFDKKTDGIGYINNALYECFNSEIGEYDYYEDIIQAAPFTGIKANQKFSINSYDGGLDLIFDANTPEVFTYGYPVYYDIPLQKYFDYDKFLSKKSLFVDETENYKFLTFDLGIGKYSDIAINEEIIGDRAIHPIVSFTYYDGVDETANAIIRGNQEKLDEFTKLAVNKYDELISQGYKDAIVDMYCTSDLSKIGPFYNASAEYSYSYYHQDKEGEYIYDSEGTSDSCCIQEGGAVMELKDFFKEGVDYKAVLKQALYSSFNNYNEEIQAEGRDYLAPIDMTNPKMDDFINAVVENIKELRVMSTYFNVIPKGEVAKLASDILGDEENWSNYQPALYSLSFTDIGTENLSIFD